MLRVYLSKNVFELGAAPNWKGSGTKGPVLFLFSLSVYKTFQSTKHAHWILNLTGVTGHLSLLVIATISKAEGLFTDLMEGPILFHRVYDTEG